MDIVKDIQKKELAADKCFEKYQIYFEPIVVTDLNFKVLYKNAAAKLNIIKLQVNRNIKKILLPESVKKLQNTVQNGKNVVVDMNVTAPFSCAVAIRDTVEFQSENSIGLKTEKVIVFIFFAAINLFQQDNYREKVETIISMYSEEISDTLKSVKFGSNALDTMLSDFEAGGGKKNVMSPINKKHAKFVTNGLKKSTWLYTNFSAYIENSKIYHDDTKKIRHEMSHFFSKLKLNISDYLEKTNYKIKFDQGNDMFVAEINEKDFYLMNLIMILIALRHSPEGIVNQQFYINDEIKSGVISYDFTLDESFFDIFKNRLNPSYLNNRKGMIDYLDLHLVALIAKNNNASLSIKSDAQSNKIIFEITINGKYYQPESDGSPISAKDNYMLSDELQDMFDYAFFCLSNIEKR